ncbi:MULTISPECIES: hypothetical protein [unclassified Streptomyces]|uniref:hypothetical protein n=1 Tax=unclassified Streptomyces TaxID=2593676 RepID=UPI0006901231|nr:MULTISPECIES: hypothetical protein [unclassified Streptomyces]
MSDTDPRYEAAFWDQSYRGASSFGVQVRMSARFQMRRPASAVGVWSAARARAWPEKSVPVTCRPAWASQMASAPSPASRLQCFAALAARVAGAGHLVIIGHHPNDLETEMPRPPQPDIFYTADDLIDDLPSIAWRAVTRTARPRTATAPDGRHVTIHDTVLTAQRTQ